MPRPFVKRTKTGIAQHLIDTFRDQLREATGKQADQLSAAQVIELGLEQGIKLNSGYFDKQLVEQTYATLNRTIATIIAAQIAAIFPDDAQAAVDADGWPVVLVRKDDGLPTTAHPLQREYIKPAQRNVQ